MRANLNIFINHEDLMEDLFTKETCFLSSQNAVVIQGLCKRGPDMRKPALCEKEGAYQPLCFCYID